MAKHRDVFEDDYPTGPIDVWPLLAEGPPPANAVVDDNGAHHDKRNGRFVKKKAPRRAVARPERPQEAPAALIRTVPVGNAGIVGYEADNSVVVAKTEKLTDGSTRHVYADGSITIILPGSPLDENRVLYKGDPGFAERAKMPAVQKEKAAPTPAIVRAWAQRNGIPVNTSGRIPQAVMDAYRKAQA